MLFALSVNDVEKLEETFSLPEMRNVTIKGSYMSSYLLGMIGHGIFQNESECDIIKQDLKLFLSYLILKLISVF